MSNPVLSDGAAKIHALFERQTHSQYSAVGPAPQPPLPPPEPWTDARLLRVQRNATRLHQLGPRAVGELLREIAHAHGLAGDIEARLTRYVQLDSATICALGADHFPPPPIHAVGDGRR